jgi:glutamate dehydrogenase/leucine dehydrogenase
MTLILKANLLTKYEILSEFMTELAKHSCDTDVPAGDIGVGERNRISLWSVQETP